MPHARSRSLSSMCRVTSRQLCGKHGGAKHLRASALSWAPATGDTAQRRTPQARTPATFFSAARTLVLLEEASCHGQELDSSSSAAGDLIYTNSPSAVDSSSSSRSNGNGTPQPAVGSCQYFWEAFPSGSGPTDRTTYLFR